MPFKSRKSLWVTSDIVWELQTAGAETRKAQELQASFIRGAVSRLADVEPRSLDWRQGEKRSLINKTKYRMRWWIYWQVWKVFIVCAILLGTNEAAEGGNWRIKHQINLGVKPFKCIVCTLESKNAFCRTIIWKWIRPGKGKADATKRDVFFKYFVNLSLCIILLQYKYELKILL